MSILRDELVFYVKETGINAFGLLDDNCRDSFFLRGDLDILLPSTNGKVQELITKYNFSECWIVKKIEKKTNPNISDDPKVIKSKLGMWFKKHFMVTKDNIDEVSKSIQLKRYVCIKKDSTRGIELDGVCINNRFITRSLVDLNLFHHQFVMDFLSKNIKLFTPYPSEFAKNIDFGNLPEGIGAYDDDGNRATSSKGFLYFFPTPLRVTAETVASMAHFYMLRGTICTVIGVRKLDPDEMKVLPRHNAHLECFYYKSGALLDEHKSTDGWAYSSLRNKPNYFANVSIDAWDFVEKKTNIIHIMSGVKVPDSWLMLSPNFCMRKKGNHIVSEPSKEIQKMINSEEFHEYMKDEDALVIFSSEGEFKRGNLTFHSFSFLGSIIDIFVNPKYKNYTEMFSESGKRLLFNTNYGEMLFLLRGQISPGTNISLNHSCYRDCRYFLHYREDRNDIEFGVNWISKKRS